MRLELSFAFDHGQTYLYHASAEVDYLAALDDATATGLTVGTAGALVDLLMPLQWNFDAPLELELLDAPSAPDLDRWEHVVEFPLALPSGRLLVEASGGSGARAVELPPGAYRGRWSGRGFPAPGDYVPQGPTPDAYRLELWPEAGDGPPRELKRWPGYDVLQGGDG